MCFLGRFYSCSKAGKKKKKTRNGGRDKRMCPLRLGVSWMEGGGVWNGAPSR